jgi:hypothetical protein
MGIGGKAFVCRIWWYVKQTLGCKINTMYTLINYGPGVDSASNRNEYQEYFLGGKGSQYVGLTNLPPSYADCLEIWEPQPPGTLRACPGL